MSLSQLPKSKGNNKSKKRRGIGAGTGNGKTAGRGNKGQKSRSGSGIPLWFEGGQMPLARKLPYKRGRGFTNYQFKKHFEVVNLSDLDKCEGIKDTVTPKELAQCGLIRYEESQVKILGTGEITKTLEIKAHKFSETAKAKIEAAKGKIELL